MTLTKTNKTFPESAHLWRSGLVATFILTSLWTTSPLRAEVVDITPNVADDIGNWTTTTVDKLDIRLNGFTGYETTGVFAQVIVEEYKSAKVTHAQHIVRLPDAIGADGQMHAYFAITHSGDQDGLGADGYWMVAEIDAEDYDEVNDRITQDINPNDGNSTEGRYVYEEHFTEDGIFSPNCTPTPCVKDGIWYSDAGDWNHPAAMARVGDVLLMVGQNWLTATIDWGQSPDAILFYDVSDPKSPRYIGKLDACDLNLVEFCGIGRDEIDNLGLAYFENGTYHLSVGRNTFTNFYCSEGLDCFKPPDTGKWMDKWKQGASTEAAGGQQGTIIHSREIYSEAPIPGEPCYKTDGTLLQEGEFDAFCAPPGKQRAVFSHAEHSSGSRYVEGSCWPYYGGCAIQNFITPFPPFVPPYLAAGSITDLHDFRRDAGIPFFDERHYVYTNPTNAADVGTVLSPGPDSLEWTGGTRARNKVYFSQLTGECQGNSGSYVDTNGEVIIYCVAESNFLYDCGNDECNPIYQNRANSAPSYGVIRITDINDNTIIYRGRGMADMDVLSDPPWGPGRLPDGSMKPGGIDWKLALSTPGTKVHVLSGEWRYYSEENHGGPDSYKLRPNFINNSYVIDLASTPRMRSLRALPEHGITLFEGSQLSGTGDSTGRMVSAIRSVPTLVRYCGADNDTCLALASQDCGSGNFLGTFFEPCSFPRTFADKASTVAVKNSAWTVYSNDFFAEPGVTFNGTSASQWSGANGVFSAGASLKRLSSTSCARPLQPVGPFEVSFPYGDSRPLLSWPNVPNANTYEIIVERGDGAIMFNDIRNDCESCLVEPTKKYMPRTNALEVGVEYRWRVRAVNKQNACYEVGPYSEFQLVTIAGPAVQLTITQTTADPSGLGSGSIEFEAGSDAPESDAGNNYFTPGSVVILRATADEGSEFVGWAGDAASCGTAATCQLTIDTGLDVQAVFRPKPRLLLLDPLGLGTVSASPQGVDCANGYVCYAYATGDGPITLTATPGPRSAFVGWSGPAECSTGLTMDTSKTCTANFTRTDYLLEVSSGGGGSVSGSDTSGAISCDSLGQACNEIYTAGIEQTVNLTATPDTVNNFTFVRWYGDADCWSPANGNGLNSSINVTVGSADVGCRAMFVEQGTEYALTVQKLGLGAGASTVTGTILPNTDLAEIDCPLPACTQQVPVGATVRLTATPVRGARFDRWTGSSQCELPQIPDPSGGEGQLMPDPNPVIDVTMTSSLSCTAQFSARILLIDGSGRGTNGLVKEYESALRVAGHGDYDIWSIIPDVRDEPTAADLASYSRVVWFTGDASVKAFSPLAGPSPDAEADLATFLDAGACFMLSSSQYNDDRGGPTPFAQNYLGVSAVSPHPFTSESVTGAGILPGFSALGTYPINSSTNQENLDLSLSDALVANNAAGTDALLSYGDGTTAAVGRDNGVYRSAYLGFPFMALPAGDTRNTAIGTFMDFCLQIDRDDAFEANDDGEAGNIRSNIDDQKASRLQGDVTLTELKILPGNDDWFRWNADFQGDTRFEILFSHESGDLNFDFYEGNRRDPSDFIQSTDDNEFIDFFTYPGQFFYLRVYGVDGASNRYTLRISSGWVDTDDDGVSNTIDIDDDGDGMSDDFEIQFGLDPLLSSDAYDDADGDGFSNLDEALGGSNPRDSASVPTPPPVVPANFTFPAGLCDPLATRGCLPVVLPWLDLLLGD